MEFLAYFFHQRSNQRRYFTSGAVGGYDGIYLCSNFDSIPGMFWAVVPSAWSCLQNRWVLVPAGTGGAVLTATLPIPDSSCHATAWQSWGKALCLHWQ